MDKISHTESESTYMEFNEPIIYKRRKKAKNRIASIIFVNRYIDLFIFNKMPRLRDKLFQISINERIVETPWVHSQIKVEGGKILDVGCYSSKLPIELASLGHEVWGIDVRYYPLKHPNFIFVQGDVYKTSFSDNFFDVITAVSTIEHIGMADPVYNDPEYPDGDKKAIKEMTRILKRGGKIIMTVPFGKRAVSWYRTYNLPSLRELLSKLKIEKIEYTIKKGESWTPASLEEVENVDQPNNPKAVALIVARKEVK